MSEIFPGLTEIQSARCLIESLRSDFCPICQGLKKPYQTMCARDYHRLPPRLKQALYASIGEGYEGAVRGAMTALHTTVFHLPPTLDRTLANRKEH
ncbi:MAG: hypothetical protein WBD40_01370 [Tepidisphaeraceae bacterium]